MAWMSTDMIDPEMVMAYLAQQSGESEQVCREPTSATKNKKLKRKSTILEVRHVPPCTPPPIPPRARRKCEVTEHGHDQADHDDDDPCDLYEENEDNRLHRGITTPLVLIRTMHGDVEHAYWNQTHAGELRDMCKSREAFRVWEHSYTYMVTHMCAEVCEAIGDGILTCRVSSTQTGFYRTDVYNVSQDAADDGLDQFNTLYGTTIEELIVLSLDTYIKKQYMDLVNELPEHFACNVVHIDGNVEILCKSELQHDIDAWLTERTIELSAKTGTTHAKSDTEMPPRDGPSQPQAAQSSTMQLGSSSSADPREENTPVTAVQNEVPHPPIPTPKPPMTRALSDRTQRSLPPLPGQLDETPNTHISKSVHGRGFLVNKKCHVYIQINDITKIHSDVIIKPTNQNLDNIEGVSNNIALLAGPILDVERHGFIERHKHLVHTNTTTTLPGNLPCERMLHVALPRAPGELTTDKVQRKCHKQLKTMFENILKKLDKKNIKIATIPPMVEEMSGVEPAKVMRSLVSALLAYKPRHHSTALPLTIHVVDSRENTLRPLVGILDSHIQKGTNTKKKCKVQRLETGRNAYTM